MDRNGRVVRFNLAYVNPQIHRGDNGRVLGYDSQHGRWHRHFMGEVSFSELQSFAEVETAFEKEVSRYLKGRVK